MTSILGSKIFYEFLVFFASSWFNRYFGESLTRFALEHARLAGAPWVDLTSNPARLAANRLYQRMGFEKRSTNMYRFKFD